MSIAEKRTNSAGATFWDTTIERELDGKVHGTISTKVSVSAVYEGLGIGSLLIPWDELASARELATTKRGPS